MIWGAISYHTRSTRGSPKHTDSEFVRQSDNSTYSTVIQGRVLRRDKAHPHTAVVTQRVLQNVDMLSWSTISPSLSQLGNVWDINERQLQNHPQSALTFPVLTQQLQKAFNSIAQIEIRHLYDTGMYACRLGFKILRVTPAINITAFPHT
ncbi:uncharacterized protein TNCV_4001741 [Trichonephila clavipes]|uniref:Uncharacterized protein n=1 Tax=Trichonephila clavipes TaxID=2585209 RepID=A0A8X6RPY0_TRICX|nr:uncharacterized protein TNCV_4001741 [Trichonephila clavipes]